MYWGIVASKRSTLLFRRLIYSTWPAPTNRVQCSVTTKKTHANPVLDTTSSKWTRSPVPESWPGTVFLLVCFLKFLQFLEKIVSSDFLVFSTQVFENKLNSRNLDLEVCHNHIFVCGNRCKVFVFRSCHN